MAPKTAEQRYRLAHAAGRDAANRQMREAGRTTWSEDDYALATRTMLQLQISTAETRPRLNPAAVSLGRLGGTARAAAMTPAQRQAAAQKAAQAPRIKRGWPKGKPRPSRDPLA